MATKAPIYLKRGSRKGKKEKLRDLLSSDMISPPLGDFRHTIHIGTGGRGDTFGDISFLQGKFHLLPRGTTGGSGEAAPFEFSRTATVSGAEAAAAPSPLLKNAISLPALGGAQALTLPAAPPKPPRLHLDEAVAASLASPVSPKPPRLHLDEAMAASLASPASPKPPRLHLDEAMAASPASPASPKPPRLHLDEAAVASPVSPLCPRAANGEADPPASLAGSLLSLHVDLGPSILEDVLQVMDRHRAEGAGPPILT